MTFSLPAHELVPGFAELGVLAFTTTREAGTFGTNGPDPVNEVMGRWGQLRRALTAGGAGQRFATGVQVHGARVAVHGPGWEGWLRVNATDGHMAPVPGTAMAVTIADCVPIFLAHPSGAVAVLHAGWRGVAAGMLERGIAAFSGQGLAASELLLHAGPSICGDCYEVGPEVHKEVLGETLPGRAPIDLRAVIERRARGLGVVNVTVSERCTLHHSEVFFSHRAGDIGRQVGVIASLARG